MLNAKGKSNENAKLWIYGQVWTLGFNQSGLLTSPDTGQCTENQDEQLSSNETQPNLQVGLLYFLDPRPFNQTTKLVSS